MPTTATPIRIIHPDGPPPGDVERKFYVTAMDDTQTKYVFLLGPFATHPEALAHVNLGSRLTHDTFPLQAPWLAYGTAGVEADAKQPETIFRLPEPVALAES